MTDRPDDDLQMIIDAEYEYDREDGEFKKKIAQHHKSSGAGQTSLAQDTPTDSVATRSDVSHSPAQSSDSTEVGPGTGSHHHKQQQEPQPETDLAPLAASSKVPAAAVDLAEAPFTWKTLTAVANTEFVPKAYRGQPDKMLGAILYGRESGLGPMTSLQLIDMISGKPSMSAELMVSLVRRAGHSLIATELTAETCTATGKRADNGDEMSFTFTMEDAKRAKLTGNNWTHYPASMLWARAASQLIRILFPDVLISIHNVSTEEYTDASNDD